MILYQGFDEHTAIEIYSGRLRVSYDIGNYPVSTMYSYEQIVNGDFHRIEMLMIGKNFTMQVSQSDIFKRCQ